MENVWICAHVYISTVVVIERTPIKIKPTSNGDSRTRHNMSILIKREEGIEKWKYWRKSSSKLCCLGIRKRNKKVVVRCQHRDQRLKIRGGWIVRAYELITHNKQTSVSLVAAYKIQVESMHIFNCRSAHKQNVKREENSTLMKHRSEEGYINRGYNM